MPALRAGFVMLTDRYIYSLIARAIVRGADPDWIKRVYSFAVKPAPGLLPAHRRRPLVPRVLQRGGIDYWESGMDLKLGDDIYDSFRAYQGKLLREYTSMAEEFHFRVLDGRRDVDTIQDELRRQVQEFLTTTDNAPEAVNVGS